MGITSIFEPQFYQTGYSKGSRHLDSHENVSSGFKSRFHSNVVQCKRVKKPCYLHIYIRVYRKCLYKWGRWPAYTLGTPRPRDATGQTGCVPLSLPKGVKPQPVRLKNKCTREQMSTGKQLWRGAPPVPPATAASSDPLHRCRAGRKEEGERSRPRYAGIPKQSGRGRIPAHAQTAQGQGSGAGWYRARGKTSGCLIQPSAETEPMGALLWEAAPERQVASSFILG